MERKFRKYERRRINVYTKSQTAQTTPNKRRNDKDFFSIYETAELLGLHHNTVRRMIKSGELPAHQFGRTWRINRADLEELTKPNNVSK